MARDPVCKMTVGEDTNQYRYEYKGTIYYFCGDGCLDRFRKDPEGYLKGEMDWVKEEKKE